MDLYPVGIMITLFLIVSGSLMAAISIQDPTTNFGMGESLRNVVSSDVSSGSMIAKFNEDLAIVSASSDLYTQTTWGGAAIIDGSAAFLQILAVGLTSWYNLIDLLFAGWATGVLLAFKLPLQLFLGTIMLFTILKFLGDIVKQLPFFGGG